MLNHYSDVYTRNLKTMRCLYCGEVGGLSYDTLPEKDITVDKKNKKSVKVSNIPVKTCKFCKESTLPMTALDHAFKAHKDGKNKTEFIGKDK
jgi:hypothetical protein